MENMKKQANLISHQSGDSSSDLSVVSSMSTWTEEKEDESGRNGDFGKVSEDCGCLQTDEGTDVVGQEVDLKMEGYCGERDMREKLKWFKYQLNFKFNKN